MTFAATIRPPPFQNRLLAALPENELALLAPFLRPVALSIRLSIEAPNQPITGVYFVEDGLVSVVAIDARDRRIEAGIIGREGMTGISVVLGGDRSPNATFVQIAGRAQRIPTGKLRQAMQSSVSLHATFLRFAQAFLTQTAQTSLANGRANVEQRLARWLLMAEDRVGDKNLALTHEFLSIMLGVRRSGVTDALHKLEGASLVRSTRGMVVVRDREGLKLLAAGFYGVSESELDRLVSRRPRQPARLVSDLVSPRELL